MTINNSKYLNQTYVFVVDYFTGLLQGTVLEQEVQSFEVAIFGRQVNRSPATVITAR